METINLGVKKNIVLAEIQHLLLTHHCRKAVKIG